VIWKFRGAVTASVPEASNGNVAPRVGRAVFPRSARLLKHADFEHVYKQGRRHFSSLMTVFYRPRTAEEVRSLIAERQRDRPTGLRVGFTVSRVLGGAVERNRMKRRLREAVRLTRPATGIEADVVINPKKSVLTADFADIVNEVRRAFEVMEKKLGRGSEMR